MIICNEDFRMYYTPCCLYIWGGGSGVFYSRRISIYDPPQFKIYWDQTGKRSMNLCYMWVKQKTSVFEIELLVQVDHLDYYLIAEFILVTVFKNNKLKFIIYTLDIKDYQKVKFTKYCLQKICISQFSSIFILYFLLCYLIPLICLIDLFHINDTGKYNLWL